jgi:ABC-2 type transport system permease protein
MTRGMLVGLIVTCVSLLFVDIQIHNVFVIFATVVLTSAVFALGGLINAIYANSFDDISIIPTFILTPLTYLGGVFYSITLLPDFWQGVSQINPIIYMVNAFRFGFLGVSDVDLSVAFGVLLLFITALFTLALTLIKKGVGLRH